MPRRLFYRLHARQQMAERGMSAADVRAVLSSGRLDPRGAPPWPALPTHIWLEWVGERALHVVLRSTPADTQYVITIYEPAPEQWDESLDEREESDEVSDLRHRFAASWCDCVCS